VNKAADQYLLLDAQTRDELASGKFRDQRRGVFGTSLPGPTAETGPARDGAAGSARDGAAGSARDGAAVKAGVTAARPDGAQPVRRRPSPRPASRPVPRRPWSKSQEKLALLYNEQGRRPQEIADKLGLSTYVVSQIILNSRNRGKL
jgi:hypothetical protein